jgi:hypothetical protein
MKKVYTLIPVLALSLAVNAQRQVGPSRAMAPVSTTENRSATPTDTITSGMDWNNATPQLFGVTVADGGGYIVGTNGYGDKQKAQVYDPGTPVVVTGAIYWFGAKHNTTNPTVKMRVYAMDGLALSTTSTSATADTPAPGTPRVSDNVPLGNVDTSLTLTNAYIHNFSAPQFCAGWFAVGFDVSGVSMAAGDTLGLVTSDDGEFSPTATADYNFEQWSDNRWFSLALAWGDQQTATPFLVDFAIFPIVEMNTGVNETPFVNGVSLGFNGANPFTDNTTLTYTLQNSAKNVTITIVDAAGKTVSSESVNNRPAGSYNFEVDGTNMPAGVYFVQLNADGRHLATKIVKN